MESLVYLQLYDLHESPEPTARTLRFPSQPAILLATALTLASVGGVEPARAQAFGQSGDAVRELQFRLQALGYDRVQATGFYGETTEQAVIDFQSRNGLAVDGVVGRNTRSRLFSNPGDFYDSSQPTGFSASNPYAFPTEGAAIAPSRAPEFSDPFWEEPREEFRERSFLTARVFRQGSRGESVRRIQERLRDLRYYYGSIDGIYGSGTRVAVEQFQAARFLNVDGIAGPQTLNALGLGDLLDTSQGYVVVVPGDNDVLYRVRGYISDARLQGSRRGNFINAGQFANRNDAERRSYYLRSRGFDARVAYNP